MKRRYRHILLAIEIGALVTAASAALAYFAHEAGAASISRALYWPNTLLQSLVSLHNIGSPEQPLYEATPLNFVAFLASFPVSVLMYSVVAYVVLSTRGRSGNVV